MLHGFGQALVWEPLGDLFDQRFDLPGQRPPLEMALSFYPVKPDEIKYSLLLQYYTELPLTPDAMGLSRLRELLPALNNKAVLGHYGVADGRPAINYRYVQALPAGETIAEQSVADVVVSAGYTPVLCLGILEGVARDQVSLDETKAQVTARYANPGAAG